tara:strand:- start:34 stop:318 length:285 start_codon:yes stop_codon:yes gene_type:complete
MNDDNKTIEFPMQPPPPTPQEQLAAEDYSWKCGACNTVVDDTTERKVLPINVGGNQQTGTPGMTFYVCPVCHTLSMPPEMFEEIHKRMASRIIT